MKVYAAAKFERVEAVRRTMALLRAAGHTITCDWTADTVNNNDLEQCARDDMDGVWCADALVIEPTKGCKGAWVEFGIALARFIPIVVIGDLDREFCVFEHLPSVHHVQTAEEAVEFLKRIRTRDQ